ncbi:hypothetical protein KI387_031941 [Taxus chinensis]|uniref:Pentatricopeptide repeat-containing protein n=1 Tax=Taxus chinensis TaxID=29808 RepID=A0AA38C0T6_TAXCH|nr:hypothetical protein KI387_031941 [Taxus chinensis]
MRLNARFLHSDATIIAENNNLKLLAPITTKNSQTDNTFKLCREGRVKDAVTILVDQSKHGIVLDSDAYAPLLHACTNFRALRPGQQLHAHMLTNGIHQNVFIQTKLVGMYAMCGCFEFARQLFDRLPKRNIFSWNGMMRGYVVHGHYEEALLIYHDMQRAGMQADNFTFPFVLKACGDLGDLQQGRDIHDCVFRNGLESDVYVGNALIAMYGKCGEVEFARQVFDKMPQRDLVSWTALIAAYAQNGRGNESLQLFGMMQLEGVKPNSVTVASVLSPCGDLAALQQGKQIHGYIINRGFEPDVYVGTALVDMYAKCGSVDFAELAFETMPYRNVVSWNGLIAGYGQNGYDIQLLEAFHQMQQDSLKPNWITFASVLPACTRLSALQQGKEIHDYILRNGFESVVLVGNALINMYAKCGSIEFAQRVFDKMPRRDVVSWSTIIAGYGMHGYGEDALKVFYQMQRAGLDPDHITFVGVLSACSHARLLDEGLQYFDIMKKTYSIAPRVEHYACIVDLLGRSGRLLDAYDLIQNIPFDCGPVVWGGLLGACRVHCEVELGECVAKVLFDLEPTNAGNYVLLSNIYADAGRWHDVARVRTMMKDKGIKMRPGCSWIELKHRVHAFHAEDTSLLPSGKK